ncbi:MAG: hypothetical protein D6681_22275 [Calditrichaeota bacterium]|nr:MAG: hypothetical protein D6681_22275 [Calditrichota bacterium]
MKQAICWMAFLLWFAGVTGLLAQREPDPNVGDERLRRVGTMDGNLVRTLFINWGEIAHWPDSPSGEWPKGTGHQYVDGVALIVQGRAIDNNGQVIYPMETQYREFVDRGPNEELWGWAPLPGYFNPEGTEPALSDDPTTWPNFWPDKPDGWVNPNEIRNDFDDDGNGLVDDVVFWNGFFGKGVRNADLEAYFVFDDDPDEEWDFYPDPANPDRRGMGLEVAARLFQWSQVLAEDVIFAVYFITNEGKYNYDSTYYAFYIDWGVGGTDDSSDDTGDYDTFLDIAWAWDYDGFGSPGRWSPVGVAGFAFLESPGIHDDGLDNDEDGVIDERRDSGPGVFLDQPPYGVDNVDNFRNFYGREPGPHWSGDEDIDWRSYTDVNGNGQWDEGEPLNDDLGRDGLGPEHFGYSGPDEGEGDGMPTPGEPNFDFTDKDESDQIGLTGFRIFPVHTYELWNEEQNWEVFRSAPPPHSQQVTANLGMFFSSGPFPLRAGQTENYSMALLFGDDFDDLVLTKKTIQQIYNADYRFAQPPEKPRLKAVIPGNGRVILVWDDRAERSFDPFLQEHDFEGYRIYRSTEPEFLENRLVTDAFGRLTFRKPIAQFDVKNEWQGLHPIDVNGAKFYLGDNSGLQHYFIDTDVQNGVTYYYAVVSYDHGLVDTSATGALVGITPAECTSNIEKDIAGNVQVDINTAVVTPRAPAAGYVEADIEGEIVRETIGTGDVKIDILIPDSVKDGHTYTIEFGDTSFFHNQGTPYYLIYDVTDGQRIPRTDTLWIDEVSQSPLVDGFTVTIYNDEVDLDMEKTGWVVGSTTTRWRVNQDKRFSALNLNINYPADFEITFTDQIADTAVNRLGFPPTLPTKFSVYNLTEGKPADYQFIEFYVKDSTLTPFFPGQSTDSIEAVMVWVEDPRSLIGVKTSWRFYLEADTTVEVVPPQPGDVFRIVTTKPFRTGDRITFTMKAPGYDPEKARQELDRIAVVPNPYVVTAVWEEKSPFRFGRGERKLYFIHLPKQCTIRIYTLRGYLVDEIEHNSTIDDGQEAWNMLNKDGQEIAYGVYIYQVDAPGIGRKIGKFAVIK